MITSKTKARFVILAAFALGVIVGGVASNLITSPKTAAPPGSVQGALQELERELKLTEEQKEQVEQILSSTRQKYRELQAQVHPRFLAIRDESRSQIKALLTPEQQVLYEQLLSRRDKERERKPKDHDGQKPK
jgi:Spy/CpxP family protein refolding chaperone